MADYGYVSPSSSSSSRTSKLRRSCSSIFTCPWLFSNFSSKGLSDTDSLMSPTSILDNTKPFPAFKTPRWPNASKTPKSDNRNSRGVGRGLIDALNDGICDPKMSKPESRMVLFGSKLNIQIPPLVPSVISPGAADSSPMSPGDFGIKTRVSSPSKKSPFGSLSSPRFFSGDMELLEGYTCVITRGPNPKTTHIFDDCVVDSCCGVVENSSSLKKRNGFVSHDESLSYPSMDFLSSCYNCKKNLGKGNDIYMYRGESAFCSSECRYKEIMSEEGMAKCDDIDGI